MAEADRGAASMRPRVITAGNREVVVQHAGGIVASMRPRLITAENVQPSRASPRPRLLQ